MDKLNKYFLLGSLDLGLNFIQMYYGQYDDPTLQKEIDVKFPPKKVLKQFDTESQQRLVLIYNYYLKEVNSYKALFVKYDFETKEEHYSNFYKLLNKINTNIPKTKYVSIETENKNIQSVTLHLNSGSTIKIDIPNIIEAFMFSMQRVIAGTNEHTYEILDPILNTTNNREVKFKDQSEVKTLLNGLKQGGKLFDDKYIRIGSEKKRLCGRFNPLILLLRNDMTFIDAHKPTKIDMCCLIIDMFELDRKGLDHTDIEEYTKPKYSPPSKISFILKKI